MSSTYSTYSRIRRVLFALLILAAVVSAINFFRRGDIRYPGMAFAAGKPMPPRTVVLVETSTNSQGASVMKRRTMAVRSDGSELEVSQSIDPRSGQVSHETHRAVFADRIIVKWVPAIKSKSTRRSPAADFQAFFLNARRDPAARCLATVGGTDLRKGAGERDGGDETIEGIRSVKVVLRNSNQPEIQMWYAPGLGCQLLRQVVRYEHPGDHPGPLVSGTATLVLESVKTGEPDASLFVAPAGYEEVSPSELDQRTTEKLTGSRKLYNPEASLAEDRKYAAQRP